MSSMADWQDVTQWEGTPIVAGAFAVTGGFQTLVSNAALGTYQNMLCYVSPGGASAVFLSFVYTLADTGAGVVNYTRSVVCPPGQTSVFTVPALTNQVTVKVLSNVNVSADIVIWPTNHERGFATGQNGNMIAVGEAVIINAGVTQDISLPVFGGRAQLNLYPTQQPFDAFLRAADVAGAKTGGLVGGLHILTANVLSEARWNIPLTWCILSVTNGSAINATYYYTLVSDLLI